MKKFLKVLLVLVLILALVGGGVLLLFGPELELKDMLEEATGLADSDFTLMMETPEHQINVEGSRLSSVDQTEVLFLSTDGWELTRVVVDGQTAYLDFWPLFEVLGETVFDFIGQDSLMDQVPDFLRRSGVIALGLEQCSAERTAARTAILTILRDSVMPELMEEANVESAEEGVVVTWEPEVLADIFTRAGERLNARDRELYIQWTALVRAWGNELDSQQNLMARMLGKIVLGVAGSREKNQAQGVAELHDRIAERAAALAEQVQTYGTPELHIWRTDFSIAQRLKWSSAQGENFIFAEIGPSSRTGVEIPGQNGAPPEENMT